MQSRQQGERLTFDREMPAEREQESNATYDAFAEALGLGEGPAEITYGQTDTYVDENGKTVKGGAYAGYKNRSDLEDAVLGRAYTLQEQGRALGEDVGYQAERADALAEMEARHQRQLAEFRHTAEFGTGADMGQSKGRSAEVQRQRADSNVNEIGQELADWEKAERERYGEVIEGADQIASMPTWQYAQLAAQELGIDPMLARGWFDEGIDAKTLDRQRDSATIQEFGVDYGERQDQLSDEEKEIEAQALEMYDQDVMSRYGVPGTQLAKESGLAPEAVLDVLEAPEFQGITDEIESAIESGDPELVAEQRDSLRRTLDPTVMSLVEAIYGAQLDPDSYAFE